MKTMLRLSFTLTLMLGVWMFFTSAASFPADPIESSKVLNKNHQSKVEQLEKRLEKTNNQKRKSKIEAKIKKIKYGQQGDALGLAALLGGIVSILLSVAVLVFLGIDWQFLVFVGLLLGAAAIIFGIVDLRYTDMPGQAYAAMIAGGLGVIAGIIALIIVK